MGYPKYIILSGGIGGAKLVEGFYNSIAPSQMAVISNTGDDIIRFGLRICPDIDIVLYTLSNMVNREQNWGIIEDSYVCLDALTRFHGPDSNWFHIGDKDLATHIFRTELLKQGNPLSKVTDIIRNKLDVACPIFPMAEDYIPTFVETDLGKFHFEEYLVKYQALLTIKKIKYGGNSESIIPERVLNLFENAEKIIIAPSNPLLSIQPILSIPFYFDSLKKHKNKVIAVSPIVNGQAIKGPLITNMKNMNLSPTSLGVAEYYKEIISTFIFDEQEVHPDLDKILNPFSALNINAYLFDTIMSSLEKKKNLAKFIMDLDLK